jgi:hypothetical protein
VRPDAYGSLKALCAGETDAAIAIDGAVDTIAKDALAKCGAINVFPQPERREPGSAPI